MSNSKFVPLAIIAIASATAVSQARAEEPLAAGSARIYPYLAGHPDRDAYTGQLTPAAKLGLYGGGSVQLRPLNHAADNSTAAAAKHRRHLAERAGGKTNSQPLNAFAQAPASARSGPPVVYYDDTPPRYDDPSRSGGQPR